MKSIFLLPLLLRDEVETLLAAVGEQRGDPDDPSWRRD